MSVERGSRPLECIEPLHRSISNFSVNQPTWTSFSKLSSLARSRSETRIHDFREILREKHQVEPYMHKYYQAKDWVDNHWWDEHSVTPKFWPTFTRARQYFKSPSYDYYFYYPARTLYPMFERGSFADTLDVGYWRQYRDPRLDQPLWLPSRPWVYESRDTTKAVKMFRQKLLTLDDLNRYWMNPYTHENKKGYTSYLQRPVFLPPFHCLKSHFQDTSVY